MNMVGGHTWGREVAWAPTWQGHQTRRTWGSHGGNGSGPEGKQFATTCYPLLAYHAVCYASQPADKNLKFIEDRALFSTKANTLRKKGWSRQCEMLGNAISQPFLNPVLT